MKREKLHSLLIGAALAFAISFGGIACVITGLELNITDGHVPSNFYKVPVEMDRILLFCILFSVVAAVAMTFRRGGWFLLGGLALVLGYLWRTGALEISLEAVLYRITYTYDLAYRCGVVRWTGADPTAVSADLGLCVLAGISAWITAWTVCHRKNVALSVISGGILLGFCLVATDTVPALWCLMVLLSGLILLMLTSIVRRRSTADGNRLTALLLIPVVLFMSLMFWAVPQDGYKDDPDSMQMFSQWFQELGNLLGVNISGNSEGTVDLSAIGPKIELHYAVMDVTAPTDGMLYLRGQSLDVYNGNSWSASPVSSGPDGGWPEGKNCVDEGDLRIATRAGLALRYFSYYPGGKNWPAGSILGSGGFANPHREREYTFALKRLKGNTDVKLSKQLEQQCLQLPADTEMLAQTHLARIGQLTGKSNRQIAEMIGSYVSGVARYDLDTQRMPSNETDFVMWFLSKADSGYCVHFASAATILLRAAGVPARYVSGYAIRAEADRTVTVTENRAHAWVEYFVPQRGWVVLDATPGEWYTEDGETTPPVVPTETTAEPTDPPETTVPQPTQTQPTEPLQQPSDPTQPTEPSGKPIQKVDLSWLWVIFKYLGILALCTGTIAGQYLLRRRLRAKKMHKGHPNVRALTRWQEVVRISRLLKEEPPEELQELAEKAKFSQHTLTAPERMEFNRYLAEAEEKIGQLPILKRWLIRLIWAI